MRYTFSSYRRSVENFYIVHMLGSNNRTLEPKRAFLYFGFLRKKEDKGIGNVL